MVAKPGREPREGFDPVLAAEVCRLFFIEERSKLEIARSLGISRFRVARLIATAKAQGLVRIEIAGLDKQNSELESGLVSAFSIKEAIVVEVSENDSRGPARAAARYLAARLKPGDVLGIGWGTTVRAVVDSLTGLPLPRPVDVVQVVGGLLIDPMLNPIELASNAAGLFGGRLFPLHAPAIVESAAVRRGLLQEAALAETVAMFPHITTALVGIGSLGQERASSLYRAGSLDPEKLRQIEEQGACGDVFAHVFDVHGRILHDFSRNVVGMRPDQIKGIPTRIGVFRGVEKTEAIHAALSGGLVNVIVTDHLTAQAVLTRHGER